MEQIKTFFSDYFTWISLPSITASDILEIFIIAFVIYQVIKWIKNTRAWALVKGLLVLVAFCVLAALLELDVILWIIKNAISVGIIAVVILFQPELRKALEELGKRNIVPTIWGLDERNENKRFSDKAIDEIVKATYELARSKTGALIVIEQNIKLTEYERTGIPIDAVITSQLLVNIFEHNTPLHDGAVIIRDNKVSAATCYLPLSDNMELSKELGTRHRAAVGISENADCLTIVVSEETGKVSVTENGILKRNIDGEHLRERLAIAQDRTGASVSKNAFKSLKGRINHEKKANK